MRRDLRAIVDEISTIRAMVALRYSNGILDELRRTRVALIFGSQVTLLGFHANLLTRGVAPLPDRQWDEAIALAERAVASNDWSPFFGIHLPEFSMIASGVPADLAGGWHENMSFIGEYEEDDPEARLEEISRERDRLVRLRSYCPPLAETNTAVEELTMAVNEGIVDIGDWGFMPGAASFELDSSFRDLLNGVAEAEPASPFGLLDAPGAEVLSNPPYLTDFVRRQIAQAAGIKFLQRRLDVDGLSMGELLFWRDKLDRHITRFRLHLLELSNDVPDTADIGAVQRWLDRAVALLEIELARLLLQIDEDRRRSRRKVVTNVGGAAIGGGGMLGVLNKSIEAFAGGDSNYRQHPLFFVYEFSRG
jgi:hypothetical protein